MRRRSSRRLRLARFLARGRRASAPGPVARDRAAWPGRASGTQGRSHRAASVEAETEKAPSMANACGTCMHKMKRKEKTRTCLIQRDANSSLRLMSWLFPVLLEAGRGRSSFKAPKDMPRRGHLRGICAPRPRASAGILGHLRASATRGWCFRTMFGYAAPRKSPASKQFI